MTTLDLNLPTRTRRLQVIVADLGSTGQLLLYSDPRPDVGAAPAANTLQCVIPLAAPAGAVVDNVLTITAGTSGLRTRADPITWGRLADGNGVPVADGWASLPAGNGIFKISAVTGYVGGTIVFSSGVISE